MEYFTVIKKAKAIRILMWNNPQDTVWSDKNVEEYKEYGSICIKWERGGNIM